MSQLRQNIITKDWVVFATSRAKRPHDFVRSPDRTLADAPPWDPHCPLCTVPAAEEEFLHLERDGRWQVRVVANRYPALSPHGDRQWQTDGIHRSISGVGYHEVLIEHPQHNLTIALMTHSDVVVILQAYRQRYEQIRHDPRIESVIIFKNHGEPAGASLIHPHSQIVATPIVPSQIRVRMADAIAHFDDSGQCLYCFTLEDELRSGERIVMETPHFVAFIPYAALSPFHLWIFPRRHASSFDQISEAELTDLAYILRSILQKLYFGLQNPAFNFTIRSIPTHEGEVEYFHWYVAIVPRVSKAAGFEMGSGMYINTAMPEDSAAFLRSVAVPPVLFP